MEIVLPISDIKNTTHRRAVILLTLPILVLLVAPTVIVWNVMVDIGKFPWIIVELAKSAISQWQRK